MLIILIRTTILYLVVLFTMRLLGKSELSKLDPFQMVTLFMIAELAAIPIESPDVSVLSGVTAILTLLFLALLMSVINMKSPKLNAWINGKPSLLIDGGRLEIDELKKLRITIDDLNEQLRLKNYASVADVDYAILETNGDLSVFPKAEKTPLTRGDVQTGSQEQQPKELLPMVLIADGHLQNTALKRLGKSEDQFKRELVAIGVQNYQDVFLCFFDEKGKLHTHLHMPKSEDLNAQVPSADSSGKQAEKKKAALSSIKNKGNKGKGKGK